jgi:flagellum-specific ATP synthase
MSKPPSPLAAFLDRARPLAAPRCTGRVSGLVGLNITISGVHAAVGDVVRISVEGGAGNPSPGSTPASSRDASQSPGFAHSTALPAEVVALAGDDLICMPLGPVTGIRVGQPVESTGAPLQIPVGPALLGRVLGGLGQPIDGGASLDHIPLVTVEGRAPNPLRRSRVDTPLATGVRAIDTLIPVGRGQRLGIFAGSGVGKSSLLSMIARGSEAEVAVICLVGERGREVREFLENDLGPEGLRRSVVVVATSDEPPMVRLRACFTATRIAEYFRDLGINVVLMMDSLTRAAMAQREVGLSAGEPPATRGYPPSVFALMPRLLERAGPGEVGSITGLYTVLVEGDDHNEPIGDTARSILDGHIALTRRLATSGHFPSIDVLESISRVTGAVTSKEQRADATALRKLLAAYRDARDLIEIGAYATGSNPEVDAARAIMPQIDMFLRQGMDDATPAAQAWQALHYLIEAAQASLPPVGQPSLPSGAGAGASR